MYFALWDLITNNQLGEFESEGEALDVAQEFLNHGGASRVKMLKLLVDLEGTGPNRLLAGGALSTRLQDRIPSAGTASV